MWALQYHRRGGPERLVVDEISPPIPRPGQALVRLMASGVSRIDAEYMRGRLPHGMGFPKQVGLDAIGQVVDGTGGPLVPERGWRSCWGLNLLPAAERP